MGTSLLKCAFAGRYRGHVCVSVFDTIEVTHCHPHGHYRAISHVLQLVVSIGQMSHFYIAVRVTQSKNSKIVYLLIADCHLLLIKGLGNSIMVSVSVCQACHPGSSLV